MFSQRLKLRIRLIFWTSVTTFTVSVIVPIVLFFLLFNEHQVRKIIDSQFDNSSYHVSIDGGIIPEFWHGLALEVRQFNVVNKNGDYLLKIQNVHCQLSWWWLIIGQYKIKHVALNDITIYEQNIVNDHFLNHLNVHGLDHSYFDSLNILEGAGVNLVQQNQLYALKDISFSVKRSISGVTSAKLFAIIHKNIPVMLTTDIIVGNDTLIRFPNFVIHAVYHNQQVAVITADTIYDISNYQLILKNLMVNTFLGLYNGRITVDNLTLNLNMVVGHNIAVNVKNKQQIINATIAQIMYLNYANLQLNKVNLTYVDHAITNFIKWQFNAKSISTTNTNIFISNQCFNKIIYNYQHNPIINANFNGICQYNVNSRLLNFSLNGTVNNSPAQIKLTLKNNGKNKPNINFQANIDQFYLESLTPPNLESTPTQFKSIFAKKTPLPFKWLADINLIGDLAIQHLKLYRLRLDNVNTKINLSNSELSIVNNNADIYQGKLNSIIRIKKLLTNEYNISNTLNIKHFNLKNFLTDIFAINQITGDADIKITTNVNNVKHTEELLSQLSAKVMLNANNGNFQMSDLYGLNNITPGDNKTPASFDKLSGELNFTHGISQNSNIHFVSSSFSIIGNGIINLVKSNIDYSFTINTILPKNQQKIHAVLIPVNISGSLANPQVKINNINLLRNKLTQVLPHKKRHTKKHIGTNR